jgi:hypothetical protein
VAALGLKPVLLEDRTQERLELGDRTGRDDKPMPQRARHVRRVVDEVIRPRRVPAVVEKLDAEVAVEREHPVAHLVNLMEERTVVGTERQAHDGTEVDTALASGDGRCRARHRGGEFAEQVGEFLGVFDGLSDAVTRQSSPRHGLLVLVVLS